MCRMCLVLKDVGSCDINTVMTVQTTPPPPPLPQPPPRHRLSLMTSGLCVNLWPGQIMSTFVVKKERKNKPLLSGELKKIIGLLVVVFLCRPCWRLCERRARCVWHL